MMDRSLQRHLDAICRRLRLASFVQAAVTGLLAGVLAYALLYVAGWFLSLPTYVVWWLSALVALVSLFVRWDRTQTRLGAAFLVDSKLGLKERLTAAVEFSTLERAESILVERLQADAARLAPTVDPKSIVPYRLPKKTFLLPPLLLLIWFLHTALPDELTHRGAALGPQSAEALQHQIDELQFLSDLFLERAAEQERADLLRLSELLRDLAERLARGELTMAELESELALLEAQMSAALDPFDPTDARPVDARTDPGQATPTSQETASPAEEREDGDETAEADDDEDATHSEEEPPEHEVGEGHDNEDGEFEEGRDGSDREQSGQGTPEDDMTWDETEEESFPGPEEAPNDGDEGDEAGTGDSTTPSAGTAPHDRPETDGTQERITGQLDSSQTIVERLERLTTPRGELVPDAASSAAEVSIVVGPEASVVREEVPPHLRGLVRRYFEQLAEDD